MIQFVLFYLLAVDDLKIRVTSSKMQIVEGESATITFTLTYPPQIKLATPSLGVHLNDFAIQNSDHQKKEERDRIVEEYIFVVKPAMLGSYVVPAVEFTYQDQGQLKSKKSSPLFIEVIKDESVVGEDIKEIKGPLPLPARFDLLDLLILSGLIGVAAYFYRYLPRKKDKIVITPGQRARQTLLKLDESLFAQRYKDFFFELSLALRLLVEEIHQVRATDMTYAQLAEALSAMEMNSELKKKILWVVEQCDLALFADQRIDWADALLLKQFFSSLIDQWSAAEKEKRKEEEEL